MCYLSKTTSHLTLVPPMTLPKKKPHEMTIEEQLEASEAKLKELLKNKGRNPKLEESADRAMSAQSIGKLLEDLDHSEGEDESE